MALEVHQFAREVKRLALGRYQLSPLPVSHPGLGAHRRFELKSQLRGYGRRGPPQILSGSTYKTNPHQETPGICLWMMPDTTQCVDGITPEFPDAACEYEERHVEKPEGIDHQTWT